MAESPRFWNLIAKFYSRQKIGDESAYQEKLRITREYLKPDAEVFELGCGTGGTARLHAPFVKHIRAVDFSEKMIAIARQRAVEEGVENVTFEVASINDVAADQAYDAVLGMSILHLLDNRQAVIGKVYEMLKPGGVFVSSTTCMGTGFHPLKIVMSVAQPLGLLPSISFFSVDQLVAEVKTAGFRIEHQWQPDPKAALALVARKPI